MRLYLTHIVRFFTNVACLGMITAPVSVSAAGLAQIPNLHPSAQVPYDSVTRTGIVGSGCILRLPPPLFDLTRFTGYQRMAEAITKISKPVVFSLCNWGWVRRFLFTTLWCDTDSRRVRRTKSGCAQLSNYAYVT